MIPGGGASLQTSNTRQLASSSQGESYFVQDNTFVVGGGSSVDKGDTGFGNGGGGGSSTLLIVAIGAATFLGGMFLMKR